MPVTKASAYIGSEIVVWSYARSPKNQSHYVVIVKSLKESS